jgi:hypothetical protein
MEKRLVLHASSDSLFFGEFAGGSVKGGGNQSFLRSAAKAAGYADGSRCPSTGRILSMAEQV